MSSKTVNNGNNSNIPEQLSNSGSSTGERRRSSGQFAGLVSQKRNSSDVSAAARKASFDDQKPAPGFLGNLWHGYVVALFTLLSGKSLKEVWAQADLFPIIYEGNWSSGW
ncbi:hypothetical protein MMC20_007905 [Loxospora ochrophaea]|nr:hypothetical protein [Loxospora ochrophaea]